MSNGSYGLVSRRDVLAVAGVASGALLIHTHYLFAADVTGAAPTPPQVYFAAVKRALEALAKLGAPVVAADAQQIEALAHRNDDVAVHEASMIVDRYTLASLSFNSDGSSHVNEAGAPQTLVEQGWRVFLIRIDNAAGRTDRINFGAGAIPRGAGNMMLGFAFLAQRAHLQDTVNKAPLIERLWLLSQLYESTPMNFDGFSVPSIGLTGAPIEFRVLQLFSRDRGRRSAGLTIYTLPQSGSGPSSAAHHAFDFECLSSRPVTLSVRDANGLGCVASLTVRDQIGRIYPPQAMRLAPDLSFQAQVYRGDGETLRLPDGEYIVESTRGPEYLCNRSTVMIDDDHTQINVRLERWIDPAAWGWYSGDTHVHAGGCLHYQVPTEGVSPETIIRQVRGEGLSVGDILSWGPSWYYQKQFFTGHAVSPAATLEHPELQVANQTSLQPHLTEEDADSTVRYDVEVSGFPSSHAGHLVLLRLKDQDYPGTRLIEDWPSWNLPILRWARSQGSLAGYAHCGSGMVVDSTELPNYEIPPMDGVGTQEAIIDATHGLVDFLSGCDYFALAELNAWYHLLNCGFRMAMVGETDFPCLSGERAGAGRSYVRLDQRPVGELGYEAWILGLQQGRLYCGDGRSHFLDFAVRGHRGGQVDLLLDRPSHVEVSATVAARLEPEPIPLHEPRDAIVVQTPPSSGWHIENARVPGTRNVPIELVINGAVVARSTCIADGVPRAIKFKAKIDRSSWAALRIFPSAHTHPVFILVGNRPIRASRRSAQWCRTCVDKVWEVKSPFIRERELPEAAAAFDHARHTYDVIARESEID
jgi:hypothetical protein